MQHPTIARIYTQAAFMLAYVVKMRVQSDIHVLYNFELGLNEANDTALRLLIRIQDSLNIRCTRRTREVIGCLFFVRKIISLREK